MQVRSWLDANQTEDLRTGEEIRSVGRMDALVPMLRATRPRLTRRERDDEGLRPDRGDPGEQAW